jgi:hypothetical protein
MARPDVLWMLGSQTGRSVELSLVGSCLRRRLMTWTTLPLMRCSSFCSAVLAYVALSSTRYGASTAGRRLSRVKVGGDSTILSH